MGYAGLNGVLTNVVLLLWGREHVVDEEWICDLAIHVQLHLTLRHKVAIEVRRRHDAYLPKCSALREHDVTRPGKVRVKESAFALVTYANSPATQRAPMF